ncbi:MAG: hypothetical protein ACI8SJ_002524 [Shewanella sp.]|jgi:hypothetical protein
MSHTRDKIKHSEFTQSVHTINRYSKISFYLGPNIKSVYTSEHLAAAQNSACELDN